MILGFPYNTVIVFLGVGLLGAAAGIIGCFAVLRRRALLGDATAHASLPGVCLGFVAAGERHMLAMLLGAFVCGLGAIAVLTLLRRWTRLKEDAGLALVLSVFYGLGIVLLTRITGRSGGGASGLESFLLGATAGMSLEDIFFLSFLAMFTLLTVGLFYKEFKLTAFDPDFAKVQGWPVFTLDYGLNLLVVLAVVIGLPAVGVLLMAALLIIPAAAARFWTDRLTCLLLLSAGFGVAGSVGGAALSSWENLSAGPTIILTSAGLFVVSLLLGPRRGLVAHFLAQWRFRWRLRHHQFLCKLQKWEQQGPGGLLASSNVESMPKILRPLLRLAAKTGLVERQGNGWLVTAAGKNQAALAARRQAQAEQYLRDHPEMASSLAEWFLSEEEGAPDRLVDPPP